MKLTRRQLLATSLIPVLTGLSPARADLTPWSNWSGALSASPMGRFAPSSEEELAHWLKITTGSIRPVGAGHSFSPLVPTDGHLVVVDKLSGLVTHDPESLQATLRSGTRISESGPLLSSIQQAMINLPDIDRQTLAGAISTSTHGTGKGLKSLSGYLTGMRLITPQGEVVEANLNDHPELFAAAAVSLGALGVVTQVSFQNRQPFRLLSRIWMEKTENVMANFDTYTRDWGHAEFMPFFHADYSLVIAHKETSKELSGPVEESDDGAILALIAATPVALRGSLINTIAAQIEPTETVQASYEALTNLRLDRFNEMEYSVPVDAGMTCLQEVLAEVKQRGIDVTTPLEYRIIGADDHWLSMFAGEDRVSISVHRDASEDYRPLFNTVEPIFRKYGGRPHWGKVHSLGYQDLKELYPRFADFTELRRELDPTGKMLNPHLKKLFEPVGS